MEASSGEGSHAFALTDLVDELARSSDDEGEESGGGMVAAPAAAAPPAPATHVPANASGGPSSDRLVGEQTASAFWRSAHELGFTAYCDALSFCGLRDELPRLAQSGLTIIAPTNEAFEQLADAVRNDTRLVRQLLLGHMCSGASTLADLQTKNCAVAVAGQTHAVYEEGGRVHVGTARFSRTDLSFDGGVIHEVSTVLMVLSLVRDSHSEQVWKKSLQPSPILSALGGTMVGGPEYEVHGCLLHAATGQLVPEALRGHVRAVRSASEEQRLAFSEITIMTKPPSLAKRRGVGTVEGANRYRLLFSIWNTSSLSYISWQHMATPLVVRNSFHMLPIEEKNYRRNEYARARSGGGGGGGSSKAPSLPALPEAGEPSQSMWSSQMDAPPPAAGADGDSGRSEPMAEDLPNMALPLPPAEAAGGRSSSSEPWLPLSQAAGLPGTQPKAPSCRARAVGHVERRGGLAGPLVDRQLDWQRDARVDWQRAGLAG